MPASQPILSICVPTFNRSHLLDVCLASLLPQVADFSQVECVVSDNASTDDTPKIIQKYTRTFDFRAHRNSENIGLLGNITQVAAKLAHGEFVWLLGDDDVLAADAVAQVVAFLQDGREIELVALNVGFFSIDKRPQADTAWGGMRDIPRYQSRRSGQPGVVPFEQLLEGPRADFTPMYASILKQKMWADEFQQPVTVDAFTSVRTTYPHAYLIAKHLPDRLAGIIPEPLVFNYEMSSQQFSWSKFHALTVVVHLTSLIKLFEKCGVSRQTLDPYYRHQLSHRGADLGELLWNKSSAGGWLEACQFAWMLRGYPWSLLKIFVVACANSQAPRLLSWPVQQYLRWRTRDQQQSQMV